MYVYIIGSYKEQLYKVGMSIDPENRVNQIQTCCPFKIYLKASYRPRQGLTPKALEALVHNHISCYNTTNEWFRLSDNSFIETNLFLRQHSHESTLDSNFFNIVSNIVNETNTSLSK